MDTNPSDDTLQAIASSYRDIADRFWETFADEPSKDDRATLEQELLNDLYTSSTIDPLLIHDLVGLLKRIRFAIDEALPREALLIGIGVSPDGDNRVYIQVIPHEQVPIIDPEPFT